MITIILTLITFTGGQEQITVTLPSVPCVHEMVSVAGSLYRVEDVTYEVESMSVHVRAVR